jgi:hypothetical protein
LGDRDMKRRFVLIGGMPRSGTTLIETVIGSHSRIAIPPGDFPFAERASTGLSVDNIFSIFKKKQTWEIWRVKDFSSVLDLDHGDAFRATLIQYAEGVGKDIPGAKAPFSEFYIDTYQDWLAGDELKFIYVLRNPFDVMASLKHSHIHTNWRGFRDLIEVQARNWLRSTSIVMARANLEPQNFCIVRYEDFVRDSVGTGLELCNFLGVDFEETSMLNRSDYAYHDTNTSFPDQFAAREDKKTYVYDPDSRKSSLSNEEVELISRICGESARSLGYEDADFEIRPPENMSKVSTLKKIRRLPRRVYRRIFR